MIFSPLSLLNALALLSIAANGNTYQQIKRSLYLNGGKTFTAIQFHKYNRCLQSGNKNRTTLSIANQIYVNEDYTLNKTFQEIAVYKFSSGIASLDFSNKSKVARIVNEFVANKTHGKINDFIKPQIIRNEAAVLLVNAVHFKGEWEHKFNKNYTRASYFYINENDKVIVDFMTMRREFGYKWMRSLEASVLEMKYANSNYSFIIVLPWSRTGLAELERKLNNFDLKRLLSFDPHRDQHEVFIRIPKFTAQHEIKLNEILKKVCEDCLSEESKNLMTILIKFEYILLLVGYD